MTRKATGWAPEPRGRQEEMILHLAPWEAATGPRTADGKARSARNAVKQGGRMASALAELAEFRRMVPPNGTEEREIRRRVCG